MKSLPFEKRAKNQDSYIKLNPKLYKYIEEIKRQMKIKKDIDLIHYLLFKEINKRIVLNREDFLIIKKTFPSKKILPDD